MSTAAILAGLSVLAALAAAREIAADHAEAVAEGLRRRARRLPVGRLPVEGLEHALDLAGRIRRAGLDRSLGVRTLLLAKATGAAVGVGIWASVAISLPGRLAVVVLALCLLAGFLAPDLVLERVVRKRQSALKATLADSLDLIALEAGAGVAVPRALTAAAERDQGPLSEELGRAVAAIEAGDPVGATLAGLGQSAGVAELNHAGRALERSQRLGSPVGEELRAQAAALRRERARAIREAAERAGPKIQLVVALALVPAVLLVIAAALLAHVGSLLGGLAV